jgi:hypothetical protein
MTEEDKAAFITGLRSGLGLTASAELSLLDPKSVSALIKSTPDFHKQCIEAIRTAARVHLNYSTTLLVEKKYKQWKYQVEQLRIFISDLILWESYCEKANLTDTVVLKACHIYPSMSECATSLGLYPAEFVEYVMNNPDLSAYLTLKNIYNF